MPSNRNPQSHRALAAGMGRNAPATEIEKPADAPPASNSSAPAPTLTGTLSLAVVQGVDVVAQIEAAERPFKTGSRGYGLYTKAVLEYGQGALIRIGGSMAVANPKAFSTGKFGWYATGKVTVNGRKYQVGGNLVVVGSDLTGEPQAGQKVVVQVGINVIEIGSKPQA